MVKNVLLTYDVSKRHNEVKNAMKDLGYFERIKRVNQSYDLPNTTLWKKGEELKTATVLAELQHVISDLNRNAPINNIIVLEKAISVEFINWDAI